MTESIHSLLPTITEKQMSSIVDIDVELCVE